MKTFKDVRALTDYLDANGYDSWDIIDGKFHFYRKDEKPRNPKPLSKPEFEELEAIMVGDADGRVHRIFFEAMAYRAKESAAIAEAVRDFVRSEKRKPDRK